VQPELIAGFKDILKIIISSRSYRIMQNLRQPERLLRQSSHPMSLKKLSGARQESPDLRKAQSDPGIASYMDQ